MKSMIVLSASLKHRSRPARGAWVEIMLVNGKPLMRVESRPARGAWVEIFSLTAVYLNALCRAPQGARGLKFGHPRGDVP